MNRLQEKVSILTQEPCGICRYFVHLQAIYLSSTTDSNSLTHTDAHTDGHISHPPAPALAAGTDVAAAPPSAAAAEASVGAAGVAKASEVHIKPPENTDSPERRRQMKK